MSGEIVPRDLPAARLIIDKTGTAYLVGDGGQLIPIEQFQPADLLTIRAIILEEADRLAKLATKAENAIIAHMVADKATVLFHPDYEEISYKGETTRAVTVDAEFVYEGLMRMARERKADPLQVAKACGREEKQVTYWVNRTSIPPLEKLGGEVLAIINAGIRFGPSETKPPKLKIVARKPELPAKRGKR